MRKLWRMVLRFVRPLCYVREGPVRVDANDITISSALGQKTPVAAIRVVAKCCLSARFFPRRHRQCPQLEKQLSHLL